MKEYIIQIDESEKNMSERFVGHLRSYPELVRCKDCKYFEPETEETVSWCNVVIKKGLKSNFYCAWAERKEE